MREVKPKGIRTKEALAESFRNLLAHKPVSKITIAEIVEGCGMTVPTFYNHFSDKYALIAWIYVSDGARIMGKVGKDGYRWKDTLLDGIIYFSENRDFVLKALAHVSGRTQFLTLMEDTNIALLQTEIRKKLRPGEDIPEDIAEMSRIYCMGTCRYVYNWLVDGTVIPPPRPLQTSARIVCRINSDIICSDRFAF